MELVERLRAWSYRRQRLGRAAADPLQALRDVVGTYSSHPTAPLALLARAPMAPDTLAELENARQVVRIPAMRVFLLPTEMAAPAFAATRQPLEKYAGNLKYRGLDLGAYAALKARLLEAAAEPRTPEQLQATVGMGGELMTVVRVMAYEGLILRLSGSLRTDDLRYVATEAWLGAPFEPVEPAEALAWLAGAYLRAFGPARVADFA